MAQGISLGERGCGPRPLSEREQGTTGEGTVGIGWKHTDQLMGKFVIPLRGDQDLRPTVEVRILLRLAQKTPQGRVERILKEEGAKEGSGFQPHVWSSMSYNRRIAICKGNWLGQVVMPPALDQPSL